MGEGGGGEEKGRFLSFSSLPFSLPSFPFSPETPDTQARVSMTFQVGVHGTMTTSEKKTEQLMVNYY